MSLWRSVEGAIYDALQAGPGATYPVVLPNEPFDPNNLTGRFSGFASGFPHILAQITEISAQKETHGSGGLRLRFGELVAFCMGQKDGAGPGALIDVGGAVSTAFDGVALSSGTIQFDTPLVVHVGENEDDTHMVVVRCPFMALVTSAA